jgi:hypothetical protein
MNRLAATALWLCVCTIDTNNIINTLLLGPGAETQRMQQHFNFGFNGRVRQLWEEFCELQVFD